MCEQEAGVSESTPCRLIRADHGASRRRFPIDLMFTVAFAETPVVSGGIVLIASATTVVTLSTRGAVQRLGWHARTAATLPEFEQELFSTETPLAVISEAAIRDADWRCLLRVTQRLRGVPSFVLASESYDPILWAELLNLGGYDLLAAPWDDENIGRVLGSAVRRSMRAREVAREQERNRTSASRVGGTQH
jgi:DNA-binding NtrC family response regulator